MATETNNPAKETPMSSSVTFKKVGVSALHIYGASGAHCGWIERSYLKSMPWRLYLFGMPPEDFRYLSDAKDTAKALGLRILKETPMNTATTPEQPAPPGRRVIIRGGWTLNVTTSGMRVPLFGFATRSWAGDRPLPIQYVEE